MSSSSSFLRFVLGLLLVVNSTFGHSQMRCANYDIASQTCLAPIRDAGETFISEDNDMTAGGGTCQSPIGNPISSAYANGPLCPDYVGCPLPMGTLQQGQTITVMWPARNHARPDQTPGNVTIYMSPVLHDGDAETNTANFKLFCVAPYISCGGENVDLTPCYASCQVPADTAIGIHTIWWKWIWPGHTSIYTTCADVNIVASTNTINPAAPPVNVVPVPSTTAAQVPSTTAAPVPVTTAANIPITTATKVPSTTAKPVVVPSTTAASPVIQPPVTQPVTPSTTAAAMPVTTAAPTPVSASSSSSSGSVSSSTGCTLGKQMCVGSNQYQTCTNARVGTYWAAPQSCRPGLSCHPSTDGNNIYCY